MIPFIDLAEQYRRLEPSVRSRMDAVLRHGRFINGPEVQELEGALAAYCGVGHCVCCSSGTDGLLMAMMAIGLGPGDAVITTPFTFIATAEPAALLGASVVFADVEEETFNLDAARIDRAVQEARAKGLTPRCVVAVDLFGLPADYDAIDEAASRHSLCVIEDAAQAFGGEYKGRKACSLARLAVTSFFPAKPLGCYGDGGAVFTNDAGLDSVLRSIRVHGQGPDKYTNVRVGLNARLDTLQAAVLLAKLEAFPEELLLRRAVADGYGRELRHLVSVPEVPIDRQSAWAQYTIRTPKRDRLAKHLKDNGIPTMVYYPIPLHLQACASGFGYRAGDFPISEALSGQVLSLPMHPYLSREAVTRIAQIAREALAGE